MNDQDVVTALQRARDNIRVGPPPMDCLERAITRRRSRDRRVISAGVMVAITGAVALWGTQGVVSLEAPETAGQASTDGPVDVEPEASLDEQPDRLMAYQQRMEPFVAAIVSAGIADPDWSGSIFSADQGSLTLYVTGEPGDELLAQIDGAPAELTVSVDHSSYTAADLRSARDEIIDLDERIASISVPATGEFLRVGLRPEYFPDGLGRETLDNLESQLDSTVELRFYLDPGMGIYPACDLGCEDSRSQG